MQGNRKSKSTKTTSVKIQPMIWSLNESINAFKNDNFGENTG